MWLLALAKFRVRKVCEDCRQEKFAEQCLEASILNFYGAIIESFGVR